MIVYSIPEMLQTAMAINTDSFLLCGAAVLLVLMFGSRSRARTLAAMAIVLTMMTVTKLIYWPFFALCLPVFQRLVARHGWRVRDVAALVLALVVPYVAYQSWVSWSSETAGSQLAYLGNTTNQQIEFLKAHPHMVLTLLRHQVRDFLHAIHRHARLHPRNAAQEI